MKTVLVSVLDWGLGHATRCIPVIKELMSQKANVLIAGNGRSLELLKQEFPELQYFELPDYDIKYSASGSIVIPLVKQLPRIVGVIGQEKDQIDKIVEQHKVDALISDNRYGCYHASVKSVMLCHQLNLQVPRYWRWATKLVNGYHHRWLKKFDEVWIPDMSGDQSLTGKLSKTKKLKARQVGILSRFEDSDSPALVNAYEIVALVSGPEPARSFFEKLVRDQLSNSSKSILLVKGLPGEPRWIRTDRLSEVNHLKANDLQAILKNAKIVIARSGYSTIMDLAVLGKLAILIPTPGQTEQEYLAKFLLEKHWAMVQNQNKMDLSKALHEVYDINPMPHIKPNLFLSQAVKDLLC